MRSFAIVTPGCSWYPSNGIHTSNGAIKSQRTSTA